MIALRRLRDAVARLAHRVGPAVGGMGFGARMLLAAVITSVAVGLMGYVLMAGQLRSSQLSDYSATQRADARAIENVNHGGRSAGPSSPEIGVLLDAIGHRPGTLEALLIDQGNVIEASGHRNHVVGSHDSDPRIDAALRSGQSYAGRELNPASDRQNFEFVTPVELAAGRYALEVSYDHAFLDANLADIRGTLELVGLFALLFGGVVFYLVGGRSLLRSHRIALNRATRDGLTDLPNHRAFQDEFQQAVASAQRHHEPLTLAVFDIDDFKSLNDRHGHPHGDAVLTSVANVLRRDARVEDRAYRLGGDEFALVIPHADEEAGRTFARRLSRALTDLQAFVSIGVSNLRAGQSAEELRGEADAALYEAKRRGRHRVAHFEEIRDEVKITTSARTDVVRQMIEEAGVTSVFQPIWDLGSHRLLAVEALMRPDPKYGLTGPAEAFDLAEQIGRGHELDVLSANQALKVAPDLPDDVLLFINLSPVTLELDANGDTWFSEAVALAGLAPSRVVIEVTERIPGRTQSVIKCLHQLRAQGFKLALDDVGTGNSGLEMLNSMTADFVKIDRSIVVAAPTDPGARAVLMAMATYSHQTGSYVIAEGIEDQECLDYLGSVGDHEVRPDRIIQGGQGFGLGRPGPLVAGSPPEPLTQAAIAHW